MSSVDNNPIAVCKRKNPAKAKIQRENKEKLVNKLLNDMFNNLYNYEDYMKGLCREALYKRTQKELKQILYGE